MTEAWLPSSSELSLRLPPADSARRSPPAFKPGPPPEAALPFNSLTRLDEACVHSAFKFVDIDSCHVTRRGPGPPGTPPESSPGCHGDGRTSRQISLPPSENFGKRRRYKQLAYTILKREHFFAVTGFYKCSLAPTACVSMKSSRRSRCYFPHA